MQYVFPLLKYKSLCDWSSHHITCVLSVLQHPLQHILQQPLQHTATHSSNHLWFARTQQRLSCLIFLPLPRIMRKFWHFWLKLSQVQICSLVQDCCRMVHKIRSCTICCDGGNGGWDYETVRQWDSETAPATCKQHTCHTRDMQTANLWNSNSKLVTCKQHTNDMQTAHLAHLSHLWHCDIVSASIAQAFVFE